MTTTHDIPGGCGGAGTYDVYPYDANGKTLPDSVWSTNDLAEAKRVALENGHAAVIAWDGAQRTVMLAILSGRVRYEAP